MQLTQLLRQPFTRIIQTYRFRSTENLLYRYAHPIPV